MLRSDLCSTIMFYYVLLCSTMFYYVLLCSTMFYYVLICTNMFYYGVLCSNICSIMQYYVLCVCIDDVSRYFTQSLLSFLMQSSAINLVYQFGKLVLSLSTRTHKDTFFSNIAILPFLLILLILFHFVWRYSTAV